MTKFSHDNLNITQLWQLYWHTGCDRALRASTSGYLRIKVAKTAKLGTEIISVVS
ncbi:hypothetical protein [Argonema antarcticum]|uniref:hypothetical protein n=1 Tax=Argonema antarcticum TaxID=2942763 RepID=UPI0020129669|nr:hypothetical protein [Argonema antarcticum]MCL1471858.1 hypothetical protein [Argonema antarcticum A004/B2]